MKKLYLKDELLRVRASRHWTQSKLAAVTGKTQSQISLWESGRPVSFRVYHQVIAKLR